MPSKMSSALRRQETYIMNIQNLKKFIQENLTEENKSSILTHGK